MAKEGRTVRFYSRGGYDGDVFTRLPQPTPTCERILSLVQPHTMVGDKRLRCLWDLVHRIDREEIPGDVVECGVWNGGSAAVLGNTATRSMPKRMLWLFDSFQGLPKPTDEDGEESHGWGGKLCGDPDRLRRVLADVGADMKRVRIVKGWFEHTLSQVDIPRIALLHLDADWYTSTRLCLETFYPCVVPGGFIVMDDYGHWEGCRRATDEFISTQGVNIALHEIDYTGRWFQKAPRIRAQSLAPVRAGTPRGS